MQGEQFTIGGDVIVKVDSTEITTADDLIAFLGTKKPGDTVTLTVERDGKTAGAQRHARGTSEQPLRRRRRRGAVRGAAPIVPLSRGPPSHFFGYGSHFF